MAAQLGQMCMEEQVSWQVGAEDPQLRGFSKQGTWTCLGLPEAQGVPEGTGLRGLQVAVARKVGVGGH